MGNGVAQEEKDILLKDLCARLPYGVKCEVIKRRIDGEMVYIRRDLELTVNNIKEIVTNSMYEIKPNLFPLSSMTDKELIEFLRIKGLNLDSYELKTFRSGETAIVSTLPLYSRHIDWLNSHHFDYRGLIEKGLAIDATGLNIY